MYWQLFWVFQNNYRNQKHIIMQFMIHTTQCVDNRYKTKNNKMRIAFIL